MGTQCSKQVLLTWEMSCLAFAILDCVAMAVMRRDFIAEDSEPPKEEGVGVPLGKVEGASDEEESLPPPPPPKNPPKDMMACF